MLQGSLVVRSARGNYKVVVAPPNILGGRHGDCSPRYQKRSPLTTSHLEADLDEADAHPASKPTTKAQATMEVVEVQRSNATAQAGHICRFCKYFFTSYSGRRKTETLLQGIGQGHCTF